MFRYKLKKSDTNEIKCQLESMEDIENPWLEKFEKFGIFQGMSIAQGNFEIIKENIDAEMAANEQRKVAKLVAFNAVKNAKTILQAAKALQNSPEKAVIKDLAKAVIQLSKIIGAADALDSEE